MSPVTRTSDVTTSATGEPGKFLHHALIDRALERNDQVGKILHRLPAPADELRLGAAPGAPRTHFGAPPGARELCFGTRRGETNRVPFLPLAAIAAFPGASGNGAWNVVDQPFRDL